MEPSNESDFAYDHVPYPGSPDAATHPRRLQAVATLLGIDAADVQRCRVLELGCASGRGLLPMAQCFPDSQFVGVDRSADRIREASELVETVGFENVEFRHASATDIDASWGEFDYILCLGMLTWVEPEVQQHLFEILRANLSPAGVGVVSYNVYPGWHSRNATRDAMRYFAGHIDKPSEQIRQARSVLEFLAETTDEDASHGKTYRRDRDYLRRTFDDYLYHDFLTDDNRPIYFHEFYGWLEQHDLRYVCETDFFVRNSPTVGTAKTQSLLQQMSFVERCQMLDFLRNESYRKSMVCHQGVAFDAASAPARMKRVRISLREIPTPAEFEVVTTEPIAFEYSGGNLNTAAPFGKAALRHLIDIYPRTVSISELHDASREILQSDPRGQGLADTCDEDQLATAMFASLHAGLIQIALHPPEFLDTLSNKPTVSPLVRALATRAVDAATPRGLDTVNQCHEIVNVNKITTFVLSQMDGTRDRDDLARSLEEAVEAGRVSIGPQPPSIQQYVDAACEEIRAFRFLVA